MNKPTVLSDGTWMLPVAVWQMGPNKHLPPEKSFDDPNTRGSRVVCSKDEGKTFELVGMAQLKEAACDEHMIVEKEDGAIWMLIRTRYGIGESTSTDGGKNWSAGKKYFVEHPTARFFIRRLKSGNLLLVKHGPIDKRTGRSHLTAFVSKDDGKSWEGGLLLDERNTVSYPDGVEAADGTIYIVYDISRTGEKEILVATFTEADAAAGKAVSDKVRLRIIANKATGVHPGKKPVKIDYKDNKDGKTLLKGAAAEVKPLFGEEQAFEKKALLFTNRQYRLLDLPKALAGKRFLKSSIDFVKAECTEDGVIYVLTPSKGRNKDSLVDVLLKKGFEKAAVPEFMLFGNIPGNVCSVYQKELKKGEKLELGKWGVLVY